MSIGDGTVFAPQPCPCCGRCPTCGSKPAAPPTYVPMPYRVFPTKVKWPDLGYPPLKVPYDPTEGWPLPDVVCGCPAD